MHLSFAFLIFALLASPALAADWVVTRVTGQATVQGPGSKPTAVTKGTVVPDGHTLSTQAGGRVRLERNAEFIIVAPGTVMTPKESWFGTTKIEQPVGRIELEVEKRNVRHFSVETPFLAAVVKGTRFVVDVSRQRASVQVSRGLVEVSNPRSGEKADIGPGQRASVAGASASGMSVSGRPSQTAAAGAASGPAGKKDDVAGPAGSRAKAGDAASGKGTDGKGADGKGQGGNGQAGRSGSEGRGDKGSGSRADSGSKSSGGGNSGQGNSGNGGPSGGDSGRSGGDSGKSGGNGGGRSSRDG